MPSKVTVPLEGVKVPEFEKLPATVKEADPEAVNMALAEIVKLPSMFNAGLLVAAVIVPVFVPLPIVK